MLNLFLIVAGVTAGGLLGAAGLIHLLGVLKLRAITGWFCRAPGLDLWIAYFTVLPMVGGPVVMITRYGGEAEVSPWLLGPAGLVAAVIGQIVTVLVWSRAHEMANAHHINGPRLVSSINRNVGPVRNHLAVWWTAWAVPLFALVRVAELFVYPPLTWLIRLPKYKTGDWVNVSRHKFEGLVGHDLIWCLYCDWMTGVWSLGTEMLRNVESFWCPIRFRSDKKCENCTIDFPDLDNGWAPSDGTMADAVASLEKHYPGPNGDNQWFGHAARLTVDGQEPQGSSSTR
ncbi:MAG: hypothetical protein AAGJ54_05840 [Planctomycetota bacterium]